MSDMLDTTIAFRPRFADRSGHRSNEPKEPCGQQTFGDLLAAGDKDVSRNAAPCDDPAAEPPGSGESLQDESGKTDRSPHDTGADQPPDKSADGAIGPAHTPVDENRTANAATETSLFEDATAAAIGNQIGSGVDRAPLGAVGGGSDGAIVHPEIVPIAFVEAVPQPRSPQGRDGGLVAMAPDLDTQNSNVPGESGLSGGVPDSELNNLASIATRAPAKAAFSVADQTGATQAVAEGPGPGIAIPAADEVGATLANPIGQGASRPGLAPGAGTETVDAAVSGLQERGQPGLEAAVTRGVDATSGTSASDRFARRIRADRRDPDTAALFGTPSQAWQGSTSAIGTPAPAAGAVEGLTGSVEAGIGQFLTESWGELLEPLAVAEDNRGPLTGGFQSTASAPTRTPEGDAFRVSQGLRSAGPQIAGLVQTTREGSLDVRLNPEELGMLRISFTQTEAGLQVSVHAERAETQDLVRRHLDLLARDLESLGFDSVDVGIGQGGEDDSSPESQRTPAAPLGGADSIASDIDVQDIHGSGLSATARLDLRL
jgi:hypothetical protein